MVAAVDRTAEVKNEKEVAFLVIAFGRLSLRRMCNDSRHGGRYTKHWESREKDSLGRIAPRRADNVIKEGTQSQKQIKTWHVGRTARLKPADLLLTLLVRSNDNRIEG